MMLSSKDLGEKTISIKRSSSSDVLEDAIRSNFQILNGYPFDLVHSSVGRKLKPVREFSDVNSLEKIIKKGKLYIVPKRNLNVMEDTDEELPDPKLDNDDRGTGTAGSVQQREGVSDYDRQVIGAPEEVAGASINNTSLSERRTLIQQQDAEYQRSLLIDQLRERTRRQEEMERTEIEERTRRQEERTRNQEERERTEIELRLQRKQRLPEEPTDGFFLLKFRTTTSWSNVIRRFRPDTEMAVLHDFVGSLEGASRTFLLVVPGLPIISSNERTGLLRDNGITSPTVIQVQWLDEDRQISGGASNQAGGSSNQAGGSSNQAGGSSNQAGGSSNQAGGSSNRAGGLSNQAGGSSNQAGGLSNQAGGSSNQAGGSSNQAGGSSNQAGGSSNQAGGSSNQAGGSSNQAGGSSNQAGGSSNQTGGSSNQAGGSSNQAGGSSNLTGGLSNQAAGVSDNEMPVISLNRRSRRRAALNADNFICSAVISDSSSSSSDDEIIFGGVDSSATVAANHANDETIPMSPDEAECLTTIMTKLSSRIDINGRKNIVNVDRDAVLDGARRAFSRPTFNQWSPLTVRFAAEMGIDNGGLTREFLQLAVTDIQDSGIFETIGDAKNLILNYKALEEGTYHFYARVISYSLVHGGPPPQFFNEVLYNTIAYGQEFTKVSLKHVSELDIRQKLQKVSDSKDANDYIEATGAMMDLIDLSGCIHLAHSYDRKQELLDNVCHFLVIGRKIMALTQFCEGLKTCGVLEAIKQNPDTMRQLFVYNKENVLTAALVEDVFSINMWAANGSNKFKKEKTTQNFWRDFLQDLEDEDRLEDLMAFSVGLKRIPPLGISPAPSIIFLHEDDHMNPITGQFPFANTCSNELKLPVLSNYQLFKSNMLAAIDQVKVFTDE